MHGRVSNSTPYLCPLDASDTPCLNHDNQKLIQTLPIDPKKEVGCKVAPGWEPLIHPKESCSSSCHRSSVSGWCPVQGGSCDWRVGVGVPFFWESLRVVQGGLCVWEAPAADSAPANLYSEGAVFLRGNGGGGKPRDSRTNREHGLRGARRAPNSSPPPPPLNSHPPAPSFPPTCPSFPRTSAWSELPSVKSMWSLVKAKTSGKGKPPVRKAWL